MLVEVKPAVMVFAASMSLAASLGVSSTQPNPMCVEDNGSLHSTNATSKWGGATMISSVLPQMPQDYYWTPAWQREELQAVAELEAGDYVEFDDVSDLLAWLDEPEA